MPYAHAAHDRQNMQSIVQPTQKMQQNRSLCGSILRANAVIRQTISHTDDMTPPHIFAILEVTLLFDF